MALEPKLQDTQAKHDLLTDLGQDESGEEGGVAWEGDDEAKTETEDAEKRHADLLKKLRSQKDTLADQLSKYSKLYSRPLLSWMI